LSDAHLPLSDIPSLHDALPIYLAPLWHRGPTLCLVNHVHTDLWAMRFGGPLAPAARLGRRLEHWALTGARQRGLLVAVSPSTAQDRKSTRLNSSHVKISYAVFC